MNAPSDPQVDSLRIPPHSIEAEQSVIGGLLRDNAAWDRIADFMHAEDFYRYDHRIIFEQMIRLINSGKPADVITVFEALSMLGKADEVGGLQYLNAMAQNTPSAANIRRYAEHSSQQMEAGIARLTEFEIAAIAAGEISGRFGQAPLGSIYEFTGFLTKKSRNSKSLVFHIIDFRVAANAEHNI